ncbi:MAG: NAD(P)H-dependent oxidoreductase subunit E [Spirochaetales bacterium]|nr:NAD(P)H-dependent oxidoreductase subunit E [Spirochaetales bacterium]
MKKIDGLVRRYGADRSSLLPVLRDIQSTCGSVSEEAVLSVAERFGIPPVAISGVVSFYRFLSEKPQGRFVIRLCKTISCDMAGKSLIASRLEAELGIPFGETTKDGQFSLEWTNCIGLCDRGPALLVNDRPFTRVTVEKVHDILEHYKSNANPGRAFEFDGTIHETFIGRLSFDRLKPDEALKEVLQRKKPEIIDEISRAGLRGRGGAGYPTAVKWSLTAVASSKEKYIVCNADEGEPGTYKDRILLSRYPDLVCEGMTVAAHALGARKGFIYLRAEYAHLKDRLAKTIEKRKRQNLLGESILGKPGFDFEIEIRMGAGAYICGEETALIESLEGGRGEPRNRPPFPVDGGFRGMPTCVNNVETFLWVLCIIARGSDWFRRAGAEKSPGYKIFSVSGDCERPGVYEFPMGVRVKDVLDHVGGTEAKAVQIGGASGSCIPEKEFDREISYEDVPTGGSVIVIGPQRGMASIACNVLEFFAEESCGQCTPCRIGTRKLLEGLKMMKSGKCSMDYWRELASLCDTMRLASKCGLGQSVPNVILSLMKHFKQELPELADQAYSHGNGG